MNFNNVKLLISAGRPDQLPKNLPAQVVVSGKSNVGKSSMINRLLGRRNFARTSATPGKTATVNFYEIDGKVILCDLPGYGFARVSKAEKEKWGRLIEAYLARPERIRLIIQLLDIRHDPTADDRSMIEWIRHSGHAFVLVCTKADKLSKTRVRTRVDEIREALGLDGEVKITAFSAQDGTGCDELRAIIENA